MTKNRPSINSRYWVWRYSIEDNPSDQLQKAIQEYIKLYQKRPFMVLISPGLDLLPPMDGLEIQPNEFVVPFRFYFALHLGNDTEHVDKKDDK